MGRIAARRPGTSDWRTARSPPTRARPAAATMPRRTYARKLRPSLAIGLAARSVTRRGGYLSSAATNVLRCVGAVKAREPLLRLDAGGRSLRRPLRKTYLWLNLAGRFS